MEKNTTVNPRNCSLVQVGESCYQITDHHCHSFETLGVENSLGREHEETEEMKFKDVLCY